MYASCFWSKNSSHGIEKDLKLFNICQQNGIFHPSPPFLLPASDLSSFYQWNRLFCSELMLIFSLQNLYLYNNFNEKTIHKVVSQHRKTKVKVPCLSLAISNNQKVYEKCQKHKPIKLPWKQLMILKSAGFYYLIC